MAAAAQYFRWGAQLRAARGTQSSGTGIALIGRASAGLGARLMSSCVWVWRVDELVSRAGSIRLDAILLRVEALLVFLPVLVAGDLLDLAPELGVESRDGSGPLGDREIRNPRRSARNWPRAMRRAASGFATAVSLGAPDEVPVPVAVPGSVRGDRIRAACWSRCRFGRGGALRIGRRVRPSGSARLGRGLRRGAGVDRVARALLGCGCRARALSRSRSAPGPWRSAPAPAPRRRWGAGARDRRPHGWRPTRRAGLARGSEEAGAAAAVAGWETPPVGLVTGSSRDRSARQRRQLVESARCDRLGGRRHSGWGRGARGRRHRSRLLRLLVWGSGRTVRFRGAGARVAARGSLPFPRSRGSSRPRAAGRPLAGVTDPGDAASCIAVGIRPPDAGAGRSGACDRSGAGSLDVGSSVSSRIGAGALTGDGAVVGCGLCGVSTTGDGVVSTGDRLVEPVAGDAGAGVGAV